MKNRTVLMFLCLCLMLPIVSLIALPSVAGDDPGHSNPAYSSNKETTMESAEPLPIPCVSEKTIETIQRPMKCPKRINPDDLEALACVIYQEAGADYISDLARYMVADVVLNRVNDSRYPDTIQEVLMQPYQYGKFGWTGIVWPPQAKYDSEKHAVERAYKIAEDVLLGNHSSIYGEGYVCQTGFIIGTDNIYVDGIYFGRLN